MTSSTKLLKEISSPEFLKKAWDALNKSNPTSHGVSVDTIAEFKANLESNITQISHQLKTNSYSFNDVRAVLFPKSEAGKFRPLRIADISDRLVQKAIAMKLEELLSTKYKLNNDCSFAYQKGRSVSDAIRKMVEHYKNGYKIVLEADIIKFFDNVNRDKLLQKVFADLPDDSLNQLIGEALAQNINKLSHIKSEHHHYFLDSIQGIPQGNAISPLLANIYLSDFDQRMIGENMKLVRYADDFIVLCKNVGQARKALDIAKEEIEDNLGLKLHALPKNISSTNSKTRIVDPVAHKFSFLSIRFDGTNVWVNPEKLKDLRSKLNDITDLSNYQNDPEFKGLITVLSRVRNLLEGWLSAFKYVDVDREFKEIDDHINYKLLAILIKMDFKIKTSAQETRKIKSVDKEASVLTTLQRKNTGIPTCAVFLGSIKRDKIII